MYFINRLSVNHRYRETVDEFTSHKEAKKILHEYQIADYSAEYYISSRCCKDWKQN